jgi:hypothetical protein
MKATIRKETPAQKRLPVRNQTTMAMMAAGRMKNKILTIKIMTMMPMTSKSKSSANSNIKGS